MVHPAFCVGSYPQQACIYVQVNVNILLPVNSGNSSITCHKVYKLLDISVETWVKSNSNMKRAGPEKPQHTVSEKPGRLDTFMDVDEVSDRPP